MGKSNIDWTDSVWNVITGYSPVSSGCAHSYAARMAMRLAGHCGYDKNTPFKPTFHVDKLDLPLRWRKPRRIFVNSMGDLFHEDVPFEWIRRVFGIMKEGNRHHYLILTKRPGRMQLVVEALTHLKLWPLNQVWLGVSVEDQATADDRIPKLLECLAAVRFVSYEPALQPVDFYKIGAKRATAYHMICGEPRRIDWLIAGGETGPGARRADHKWFEDVRDQCQAAGIAFFFKGLGGRIKNRLLDGREWNEFPKGQT